MAIIKPVIYEDGRLKTAGMDDQVPQSFVEGLEPSLESKASKSELSAGLELKVDKEEGKGLSTEDYTTSEKDKLAGIQAGAQVNTVTSVSGKIGEVTLDKDDVGLGNVDNTPDIDKPISNPVQAALDNKVDKVDGKGLSDTNFTQAEKDKLAGVASEATKNRDDSENADKEHTHTVDQVTGLVTALDSKASRTELTDGLALKVDKVEGKGLSDANFTQAEKDKLASLESSKFVGLFVSESELPTTGSEGEYADVDGGVGNDVYRVIWDSSDNKWVRMQGVSTDLTTSQIKQLYESNPDTNAFTDDEKAKLSSVASGATANRSDSENADKVHSHTMDQVTGLEAALAGKASTTDPRFTDAREWAEATVPQEEAEAGTASIRRAWTAQRVWQAINAWWQSITSGFGRNLIAASNEEAARDVLQLGTAATSNITISPNAPSGGSNGDVWLQYEE